MRQSLAMSGSVSLLAAWLSALPGSCGGQQEALLKALHFLPVTKAELEWLFQFHVLDHVAQLASAEAAADVRGPAVLLRVLPRFPLPWTGTNHSRYLCAVSSSLFPWDAFFVSICPGGLCIPARALLCRFGSSLLP